MFLYQGVQHISEEEMRFNETCLVDCSRPFTSRQLWQGFNLELLGKLQVFSLLERGYERFQRCLYLGFTHVCRKVGEVDPQVICNITNSSFQVEIQHFSERRRLLLGCQIRFKKLKSETLLPDWELSLALSDQGMKVGPSVWKIWEYRGAYREFHNIINLKTIKNLGNREVKHDLSFFKAELGEAICDVQVALEDRILKSELLMKLTPAKSTNLLSSKFLSG